MVGFEAQPDGDPRDAWLPVAFEELLTWRLRRVPGLIAIPTVRLYQGRLELQEPGGPPPPWPQVARGMGAGYLLSGRCHGPDSAVGLELTWSRIDEAETGSATGPQRVTVPEGRLFDVLDEATRWVQARLKPGDLDEPALKAALALPTRSATAVEYYARAHAATREEKLPAALRYAAEAARSDSRFRAAIGLLAQLEMRLGPAGLDSAASRLRIVSDLARIDGDGLDRVQAELGLSQISGAAGAFDAACTRAETALALAFEQGDIYGQMGVINWLCDLYVTRTPPPGVTLSDEARRTFVRENLRRAAEWQHTLLEMLDALHDRIAGLPATSKLALIYERLGETERAFELHQQTLAIATALNSRGHQAAAWMYLGQWYRDRERWPEALDALSRCVVLADESAKPAVRVVLGGVYQAMKLPEEALGQFEQAYAEVRKGDDLANQFACLRGMARLRKQLGKREAAITALQDAIDIAHVLELPEEKTLREDLQAWKENRP